MFAATAASPDDQTLHSPCCFGSNGIAVFDPSRFACRSMQSAAESEAGVAL